MIQEIAKAFIVVWCLVGTGLSAASIFSGITTTGLSTEAAEAIVDPPVDPPSGNSVTASIEAHRTTCRAPCFIYFTMKDTTSTNYSTDWELESELQYHMDFGDPGSGTWGMGALAEMGEAFPKNIELSRKGGHVYETPGVYTVTGTAWDHNVSVNEADSATVQVTIVSPESFYPESNRTCLSANSLPVAGSNGCPSGASVYNLTAEFGSADYSRGANELCRFEQVTDPGPQWCLVERGGTYFGTEQILGRNDDHLFTAFGSGPAPILNKGNHHFFSYLTTGQNPPDRITVADFRIIGDNTIGTVAQPKWSVFSAVGPVFREALVLRVDTERIDGNFFTHSGMSQADWTALENNPDFEGMPHHSAVVDSRSWDRIAAGPVSDNPNVQSGAISDWFGPCRNCMIAGNQFGNAQGDEHIIRTNYATDTLWAHNSWGYTWGQNRQLGKVHNPAAQSTSGNDGLCNRGMIWSDNVFHDSESISAAGMNQFGGQNSSANIPTDDKACVKWNIVERNAYKMEDDEGFNTTIWLVQNGPNMFRNEIVLASNASVGDPKVTYISFATLVTQAIERFSVDNTVENISYMDNSINQDDVVKILSVETERTRFRNSIFYHSLAGQPRNVYVDAATDSEIFNIIDVRSNGVNPFSSANPTLIDDFKLVPSAVVNDASGPGVDILGRCRTTGAKTVGALQNDSDVATCIWDGGTPSASLPNANSAIGMNVARLRSWEPVTPIANAAKGLTHLREVPSGGSCASDAGNSYSGARDANGYPTEFGTRECIQSRLYQDGYAVSNWQTGEWSLLHDGTAGWSVGDAASGLSGGGGRVTFDVGTTGNGIRLNQTSGTNMTNLRLYPPGGVCAANASAPYEPEPAQYCSTSRCTGGSCNGAVSCGSAAPNCIEIETVAEAGELTFHPLWLSHMTRYGTLRMMDAMHTNYHQSSDFAELTQVDDITWEYNSGDTAIPLAIQIELANTLQADPWFNVPHNYTDASMTAMITQVRDNLGPNLSAYFEFSNETWNGGTFQPPFGQGGQLIDFGETLTVAADGFDGAACAANRPACAQSVTGYRAWRMNEIGKSLMGARYLGVFAGQAGNANVLARVLDCSMWVNAPGGNCYSGAGAPDNVAIGVYAGDAADCGAATPAAVCSALDADVSTIQAQVAAHVSVLSTRDPSLGVWGYEGGEHLDAVSIAGEAQCIALRSTPGSCLEASTEGFVTAFLDSPGTEGFLGFTGSTTYTPGRGGFGHFNNMSLVGILPKEKALFDIVDNPAYDRDW